MPPRILLVLIEEYTKTQQAMILAQCHVESAGFAMTEENLSYSAKGLLQTFPKYFKTLNDAKPYAGNPKGLANKVYANRMGNGGPETNDGYTFRGRGLIQITGRENYTAYKKDTGIDVLADPDLIKYPGSVIWFLTKRAGKFMYYANLGDVERCTKLVNGGDHGFEMRKKMYDYYLKQLNLQVVIG